MISRQNGRNSTEIPWESWKRRGIYCKCLESLLFSFKEIEVASLHTGEFVHSRVVCWFFAVSCPRFCVKSFSLDYSLQHGPGEAQLVLSWGLQQREARRSEVQVLWSATAAGHGRIHLLVPGWFHRTQGAAMELKAASTQLIVRTGGPIGSGTIGMLGHVFQIQVRANHVF